MTASQSSSNGSGDNLVLGALAAVFGAAGVVWLGAATSAAVTGHGALRAGMGEAVQAIVRLPAHRSNPKLAWPMTARDQLPGPIVYWLATAAVAAVAVAVGRLGWRWFKQSSDRGRVRLGVDVRAKFATLNDLAPLVVKSPVAEGRFVLGRVNGRLVATEDARNAPVETKRFGGKVRQGDRGSVAIIGPTRSGKTVNVIASLRDWPGPAVVVSIKRDLIDASIEIRSKRGTVAVFDPAGISGIDETVRWSPLRAATSPTGAQKAAAALAAAIPRSGVEGGADYWVSLAETLLTGLLATAALDPTKTMEDVATWAFLKDMPVPGGAPSQVIRVLHKASTTGTPQQITQARWAIKQLHSIWRQDDRVRSSVYATAQTVVKAWLDPRVAASACRTGPTRGEVVTFVDLDWLDEDANTLYLVAPLDDQKRLAPVLGGLIGDLKDQAYQWDVQGRRLQSPLLLVIDEAGNMPLTWLPEVASTCAGIGILLVTIWQSKSQLDAAYGKLADSVLTNHLTKIVFSGCSDASTLDYISRLLGDEEVQRRSTSYDIAGGSGRKSVNESPQRESLTPFHVLRQFEPGQAVLIHGTLPPAHLHTRKWWLEPEPEWPGVEQQR